ncbi:tRNA (5-methylaminomethyl-2-thiouridylate)-methyltransferase [Plasticicumulans lactativorans]|uniref:tRNA-specific 2-thiouridylase MnmA n=1 Tax=Plasticicumulans lactativorans TaxID=1133106 RepID=A0A4R2LRR4_9GAMM|nr:tRNA 2-thiouridine(34) synthase MnmA [Plasticicumulans lactativorans]TCO82345.1 tRNA (5-methylaminomethyl-2-thiouridylate)-methyltransferase [Plasticicumulans lactativorans]
MNPPRIVVGLSGGVDSSVAALLLHEQGFEVHGVFMRNWEDTPDTGQCSAGEDLRDAAEVCETLGIPFHQVNFTAEYRERVFAYFLAEHRAGRTPNPDVLCNKEIKFRAFLEHAGRLGASGIATGHYARCEARDGRLRLLKGLDPGKDQSYFLYTLGQAQLAPTRFPVGALPKREVRAIAARARLPTHDKKDSTGICFIGERDFREFLGHYLPHTPGPMLTPEGEEVGTHVGLAFYTLGQRQGLAIGGRRGSSGRPWFVAGKDLARNALLVVQGDGHPALYAGGLRAGALHWVAGHAPALPLRANAKVRYRQADQPCTITALDAGACEVRFDTPQRAVTPGQSVVFYQGDECLGGGVIDAVLA